MRAQNELLDAIQVLIDKSLKDKATKVTGGKVKSASGGLATGTINGYDYSIPYSGTAPTVGSTVRVFIPNGNMSDAFIGGGGSGGGSSTTNYNSLTNKPSINGVVLYGDQASKDLKLYGDGNQPPYPVTSVNGQTGDVTIEAGGVTSVNGKSGDVTLTASDVGALPSSGGTLTGNLTVGSAKIQTNGYVVGTWLQGTATNHLTKAATKIAVQDGSGWVYHRTAEEIKSDIGLSNVDNVKQYSASNPPPYPVTSVNGKTGAVNLSASDVGAVPTSRTVNGHSLSNNVTITKSDVGLGSVANERQYSANNPPPYPVTSVNGQTGAVEIDVGGGGTTIVLSSSQPSGLKAGDYWYQIVT